MHRAIDLIESIILMPRRARASQQQLSCAVYAPRSSIVIYFKLFISKLIEQYLFYLTEDSFVRKAKIIKGIRRHARGKMGIIQYRYTHYFLRLREGRPPKHYYPPRPTGNQMVEQHLEQLRERRIISAL